MHLVHDSYSSRLIILRFLASERTSTPLPSQLTRPHTHTRFLSTYLQTYLPSFCCASAFSCIFLDGLLLPRVGSELVAAAANKHAHTSTHAPGCGGRADEQVLTHHTLISSEAAAAESVKVTTVKLKRCMHPSSGSFAFATRTPTQILFHPHTSDDLPTCLLAYLPSTFQL